jgi:hypothetical protein
MNRRTAVALGGIVVVWLCATMPRGLGTEAAPMEPRRSVREAPEPRVPEWQVLAPRHRETSPAPIVAFVTPGWSGHVEVRVETPRGVHTTVTRGRSLSWPRELRPLATGAWCAVTVSGCGGRMATATALRVPPPRDGARESAADFLSVGLPAAACLDGGPHLGAALLRAGLERLTAPRRSDTMARARERGVQAPWPR